MESNLLDEILCLCRCRLNNFYYIKKYVNKSFVKNDLLDPYVFDIIELRNYVESCHNFRDFFLLIETGIYIVKNNENYSFKLHYRYHSLENVVPSRLTLDSLELGVHIYDVRCNIDYEIYYKNFYSEGKIYVKVNSTQNTYEFDNFIQVKSFFNKR